MLANQRLQKQKTRVDDLNSGRHGHYPIVLQQFATYLLVGGICALLYLLVAFVAMRWLSLTVLFANWLGLIFTQPLAYFLHKKVTFQLVTSSSVPAKRFFAVAVLALIVSTATTLAVEHGTDQYILILLVNCIAVPLLNFLLLKIWVFVVRK